MDNLKKTCQRTWRSSSGTEFCGHEQDSHHEGQHNCLSNYCDCPEYLSEAEAAKEPSERKTDPPPQSLSIKTPPMPFIPHPGFPFGWGVSS